jgi:hypothetical protein
LSWLAILLAIASLGGSPVSPPGKAKPRCSHTVKKHCTKPKPKKKKPTSKPKQPGSSQPAAPQDDPPPSTHRSDPTPTPTPAATRTPAPTPTASPAPTATPVLPRRTAVDLVEYDIRSSYLTLGSGQVSFNANNLGEDDHNLSVRGGGQEWGKLDLAPGDRETLTLTLPAGDYTLYCSLLGHEEAGMRLNISVR